MFKFLTSVLVLITTVFGCRQSSPKEPEAEVKSAQILATGGMVVVSIGLLKEASKATFSWLWGKTLEKELGSKSLGEAAAFDAKHLSSTFKFHLDQEKSNQIYIKLNSLQKSLRNDYIAGLPESATQLALMTDKANDVMATIENLARQTQDPASIQIALTHLSAYAFVSTVKLTIQQERLKEAKKNKKIASQTLSQLSDSMTRTAAEVVLFLTTAAGPIADSYVKEHVLEYELKEVFAREEFDVKFGVGYQYCVKIKGSHRASEKAQEHETCGSKSPLTCANDLAEGCLVKAQNAATQSLLNGPTNLAFIRQVKKSLISPDLPAFISALERLPSEH